MKHPKIANVLGWNEEPATEEGIFLQPEEATAIESALVTTEEAEAAGIALTEANSTISTLNAQITSLNEDAVKYVTNAAAQTTKITELEADVKKLGGESSGPAGTKIDVKEDEKIPETKTSVTGRPRYDDPAHPANAAAQKWAPRKK